jgi:hypothetical protein
MSSFPSPAYALGPEGLVLPVIDICHPAFALDPSKAELAARLEEACARMRDFAAMPGLERARAMESAMRDSRLTAAIGAARGGYLGGMATYLLKLGPENLGPWATAADRELASTLPCYSARLRLRDSAKLLAAELKAALAAAGGKTLRLVGVAAGPAMELLNALMLARREGSPALEGRRVRLQVLDLDGEGPAFGERALRALMAEGQALSGLDLGFSSAAYDWDEPSALAGLLGAIDPGREIAVFSSEGGLFEYASDESISANLRAIAAAAPAGTAMAGTMSVAEEPARLFNQGSGTALRLRSLEELSGLCARSLWRLERVVDCPLSRSFLLRLEG